MDLSDPVAQAELNLEKRIQVQDEEEQKKKAELRQRALEQLHQFYEERTHLIEKRSQSNPIQQESPHQPSWISIMSLIESSSDKQRMYELYDSLTDQPPKLSNDKQKNLPFKIHYKPSEVVQSIEKVSSSPKPKPIPINSRIEEPIKKEPKQNSPEPISKPQPIETPNQPEPSIPEPVSEPTIVEDPTSTIQEPVVEEIPNPEPPAIEEISNDSQHVLEQVEEQSVIDDTVSQPDTPKKDEPKEIPQVVNSERQIPAEFGDDFVLPSKDLKFSDTLSSDPETNLSFDDLQSSPFEFESSDNFDVNFADFKSVDQTDMFSSPEFSPQFDAHFDSQFESADWSSNDSWQENDGPDFDSFSDEFSDYEQLCKRIIADKQGELIMDTIQDGNDHFLSWLKSSLEHLEALKSVLTKTKTEDTQRSTLHVAAVSANPSWVAFLISIGLNSSPDSDGNTPLHLAAAIGDSESAQVMIDKGFDVNCRNNNSRTPLHLACVNGQSECVELLLENDADIFLLDKEGATPLHLCCLRANLSTIKQLLSNSSDKIWSKGDFMGRPPLFASAHTAHWDACGKLLDAGATINHTDHKGRSALLWCLTQAGLESNHMNVLHCAKKLIEAGANVNHVDQNKRSALHYACYYGLDACVEFLLNEHQLDVNPVDENNETPLHAVVSNEKLSDQHTELIVSMLLSKGAKPEIKNETNDMTPLHLAIVRGKTATAQVLLGYVRENNSFSIEDTTTDGESLLHFALLHGVVSVANLLADAQPSLISLTCSNGWTIFHAIAKSGNSDALHKILSSSSSEELLPLLCQKDNSQRSPLHIATGVGHMEFLDAVLEYSDSMKQELLSPDACGNLPIHYAALRGRFYVLTFLVDLQPESIHQTNEEEQTPLHAAVAGNGATECVRFLLDSGADINCKDSTDRSPIFYAVLKGDLDLISLLLNEYSADATLLDADGNSLVGISSRSPKCEEILRILESDT